MDFSKILRTSPRLVIVFVLNKIANRFGYGFQKSGLGYYSAKDIVRKAKYRNLTICEFLETFERSAEGQKGRRDFIIKSISDFIPRSVVNPKILEIGTGTGIFFEKFVELYQPILYESYETNVGWAAYLRKEYSSRVKLVSRIPNGYNLQDTLSASMDILVCHGVFVYLPVVQSFGYLLEMVRVCKDNGLIIFDCFVSDNLSIESILKFTDAKKYFPVFVTKKLVEEFAVQNNLRLIHSFDAGYHESYSTYFIFQKL